MKLSYGLSGSPFTVSSDPSREGQAPTGVVRIAGMEPASWPFSVRSVLQLVAGFCALIAGTCYTLTFDSQGFSCM